MGANASGNISNLSPGKADAKDRCNTQPTTESVPRKSLAANLVCAPTNEGNSHPSVKTDHLRPEKKEKTDQIVIENIGSEE